MSILSFPASRSLVGPREPTGEPGAGWWAPCPTRFGLDNASDARFICSPEGVDHVVFMNNNTLYVHSIEGTRVARHECAGRDARMFGTSGSFVACMSYGFMSTFVEVWNPFSSSLLKRNHPGYPNVMCVASNGSYVYYKYSDQARDYIITSVDVSGNIIDIPFRFQLDDETMYSSINTFSSCECAYGYAVRKMDDGLNVQFRINYTDGRESMHVPIRNVTDNYMHNIKFWLRELGNVLYVWNGSLLRFEVGGAHPTTSIDAINLDGTSRLSPDASYILTIQNQLPRLYNVKHGWSMNIAENEPVEDMHWSNHSDSFIYKLRVPIEGSYVKLYARLLWSKNRNEFPPAVKQEAVWQSHLLNRPKYDKALGAATRDYLMQSAVDSMDINERTTPEDLGRISTFNALRRLTDDTASIVS